MPTFSKRTMRANIAVHDPEREPCLMRALAPFSSRKLDGPGMILTCRNCATRYQADAAKFQPAGRNVRCAQCGHLRHQDGPPSAGERRVELAAPEPVPPPPPPPPPVIVPPASARSQAF